MSSSTSSSERPSRAGGRWALGLTLLIFLLLEIGFRLAHFGLPAVIRPWNYTASAFLDSKFLVPVPDPSVGWKLRGGVSGFYRGAPLSTNSHGFRDRERTVEKPRGVLRVAVLGASVTMGAGVGDEETYTRRLEAILDRHEPGRYEILNFAVPSYTLPQSLAAHRAYGRRFSPDVVMIRQTVGQQVRLAPPLPLAATRPRPTDLRHRLGYLFVYWRVRALIRDGSGDWLASDWTRRARPAGAEGIPLDEFVERQAAAWAGEEARIVFALVPGLPTREASPRQIASVRRRAETISRRLSRHAGVEVIDAYPALLGQLRRSDRIYPGDNHPNARAHQLIAEALAPELRRILHALPSPARADPPSPTSLARLP